MIELDQLRDFLLSKSSENAKNHLVFPLFQKLFGSKFKKESDAQGADIYIEGKLIVELKSDADNYLPAFYQALHYEKKGLSFPSLSVIAHKYIGVWKKKDIPREALEIAKKSDPLKSPSDIGVTNARKTPPSLKKEIQQAAIFTLVPSDLEGFFETGIDTHLNEFSQVLKNLESDRIQISPRNFIQKIELLEKFFDKQLDAIHCFYAIVGYWNATSKVTENEEANLLYVHDFISNKISEPIIIKPRFKERFIKFVESHYIFTNEGSGLTVDYYFSRFDEVIAKLYPEYAKQHGIFFTDHNLSKFALWFVHNYFETRLSDKYIVFDPAGGSGNLVTSWRGHLKHKIVSELQPDLLRTIERRMKLDSEEIQAGFTIIPKTSENKGLNFLDKSAEEYVSELLNELSLKNLSLDKPIAFLLNPPYKNTDENETKRESNEAEYDIHQTILDITGNDAGKERYLAFLGQILNISRLQMGQLQREKLQFESFNVPQALDKNKIETPLVLIFTPTSWLIPRPTYKKFREEFDKYFKYEMGFIVLGNEFFKIKGRFPIAFTIWSYKFNPKGNKNKVKVRDFTYLAASDIAINWNSTLGNLKKDMSEYFAKSKIVKLDNSRGDIRDLLPKVLSKKGELIKQPRYDYSTAKKEKEFNKIVSGFPFLDKKNHFELKRKCGDPKGSFVGFYDDNTPVRVNQDNYLRMSNKPDRVWFRLDNVFINLNQTRIQSGPPDKYGFCAYDLESAKTTLSWFAITKALNGRYPIWANQYDIWAPKVPKEQEKFFYSLCFAFALSNNGCVVTKFEKDNPLDGAPEVYVDNPLCPSNPESFWSTTLDKQIIKRPTLANDLVNLVKELYKLWNVKYCKGGTLYNVGLEDEAYFRYFNYNDFLTPHSGLIQIRKYAEHKNDIKLMNLFDEISQLTKDVREKIYKLLVDDFGYFD